MIGKLFGSGSGFYLELEEDGEEVASQVSQVTEAVAEKAADVASDVAKTTEKAATETAKTTSDTAKPTEDKAAAAPAATIEVIPEPVDIIRAALASMPAPASATEEVPTAQSGTFATDYLTSTPAPRRRPGPSLAKFKTMAKDFRR